MEIEIIITALDLHDGFAPAGFCKSRASKCGKPSLNFAGIIVTDAETDAGERATEHSVSDFFVALQLPQLLMSQYSTKADTCVCRSIFAPLSA